MSSSPDPSGDAGPSGEPVELVLIGRTLRGTLGEAFRRDALAWFESRHGAGGARPLRSSLSRTVELTAVALTRAGAVSVDVGIADPAFRSPSPRSVPEAGDAGVGERVFEVPIDDVEGIGPIAGPPGVDLTRWAVVRVRPDDLGTLLAFHVAVLRAE